MIILVAYDAEGPESPKLMAAAKSYAQAFKAEVYVVGCLPGSKVTKCSWEQKADSLFAEFGNFLKENRIKFQIHSLYTSRTPGEKIIDFVAENQIDLIIIELRSKSKLDKLFFGSNAQYIILKAPCPVLTVS